MAESAKTGVSGIISLISEICLYAGRKLCPHSEMQCASSTVIRLMFISLILVCTNSFCNLSGDKYKNFTPP